MAKWFFDIFRNIITSAFNQNTGKMDKDNGYRSSIDHMIMCRKQKTSNFGCAIDKNILHVHTKMVSWLGASNRWQLNKDVRMRCDVVFLLCLRNKMHKFSISVHFCYKAKVQKHCYNTILYSRNLCFFNSNRIWQYSALARNIYNLCGLNCTLLLFYLLVENQGEKRWLCKRY